MVSVSVKYLNITSEHVKESYCIFVPPIKTIGFIIEKGIGCHHKKGSEIQRKGVRGRVKEMF